MDVVTGALFLALAVGGFFLLVAPAIVGARTPGGHTTGALVLCTLALVSVFFVHPLIGVGLWGLAWLVALSGNASNRRRDHEKNLISEIQGLRNEVASLKSRDGERA